MTSKKRTITAVIGLALGAAIFSGAALADLPTSNGYEVGKTAIKGLMKNENYTMEMSGAFSLDGNEISKFEAKEQYDRNGDVVLHCEEKQISSEEYKNFNGRASEYRNYYQDGQNISVYIRNDGSEESYIRSGDIYGGYGTRGKLDSFYSEDATEDDRNMQNKIVRFAELIADTFVGDLKNNIIYVSGDDNSSTYEMSLDAMQIPEVVNAGISAMFSAVNSSNQHIDKEYRDPYLILGTDPVIKNVSLRFTVDSEKRLSDITVKAAAAGNGHEGAVEGTMKIYDYGTTQPERVDISSLKNVTKYDDEYYERMEKSAPTTEADAEAAEKAMSVTSDGEVLDEDGNVVGHIQINADGEGVIVGGADGSTSITITQ